MGCQLCFDQLLVAYNYHVLTQNHIAVAINSQKPTQADTGTIRFKGYKNPRMHVGTMWQRTCKYNHHPPSFYSHDYSQSSTQQQVVNTVPTKSPCRPQIQMCVSCPDSTPVLHRCSQLQCRTTKGCNHQPCGKIKRWRGEGGLRSRQDEAEAATYLVLNQIFLFSYVLCILAFTKASMSRSLFSVRYSSHQSYINGIEITYLEYQYVLTHGHRLQVLMYDHQGS